MASDKTSRSASSEDHKKIMKIGLLLTALAFTFMGVFYAAVHYNVIRLHPASVKAEALNSLPAKVEFALRYQTLLVFWLMINVFIVIGGRYENKAFNPLDEKVEVRVQGRKNVLTNSYETLILSIFSQLIFVTFAPAECILKFIPYVNIVQFIGRIAFFYGYPMKRAFGFQCTMVPTIFMVVYNMYKLSTFVLN